MGKKNKWEWISVKDKLPEVDERTFSDTVLVNVVDEDFDDYDDDIKQFHARAEVYTGYLCKLSNGKLIWLCYIGEEPIATGGRLVTHWTPMPLPVF